MRKSYLIIGAIWLLVLGGSCQSKTDEPFITQGYDLGNPEKIFMPDILLEVSGISFYPGNNDSIWAVQDERGMVFQLKQGEKKYRDFRFAKDGDYEDLSFLNQDLYVLRSDGHIFRIPAASGKGLLVDSTREWSDLLPEAEYEGLYGDSLSQSLYAMTKVNGSRKSEKGTSIYKLNLIEDGRLEKSDRITVSDDTINSILGKKMKAGRFQPSGLARHPATGDWYLISSVNKLLIVANSNFQIESVWPLLPSRFRQPEGIAFDRLGNMYISNEGDEVSSGNVLKFEYHPPNSQP